MTNILTILLCTAFGSFMFELAGITQKIFYFFKVKPFKPFNCGKCMSFHTTWIYFHATNHDWITSISFACVSGIISIYLIKYAYTNSIH